jgi:hypothetical protein
MLPGNETLSKLLGSLYDAAADAKLWEPFLRELARTSRAHSAALVMHHIGPESHTGLVDGAWTITDTVDAAGKGLSSIKGRGLAWAAIGAQHLFIWSYLED